MQTKEEIYQEIYDKLGEGWDTPEPPFKSPVTEHFRLKRLLCFFSLGLLHWEGWKGLGMWGDANRCAVCGMDRFGLPVLFETKENNNETLEWLHPVYVLRHFSRGCFDGMLR